MDKITKKGSHFSSLTFSGSLKNLIKITYLLQQQYCSYNIQLVEYVHRERVYTNLIGDKQTILDANQQLSRIVPNDNTNTSSALYVTRNSIFVGNGKISTATKNVVVIVKVV